MITILTGPIGGGKTSYLKSAIIRIRDRGLPVEGYLSERIMEGTTVSGYDLVNLGTGKHHRLLRRSAGSRSAAVGPFDINPKGFAAARAIIERSDPSGLLVLDELGRLELEGKGVWPAADPVLGDNRRRVLVVIRESLLDEYQIRFRTAARPVAVIRLPESKDPEILAGQVAGRRP